MRLSTNQQPPVSISSARPSRLDSLENRGSEFEARLITGNNQHPLVHERGLREVLNPELTERNDTIRDLRRQIRELHLDYEERLTEIEERHEQQIADVQLNERETQNIQDQSIENLTDLLQALKREKERNTQKALDTALAIRKKYHNTGRKVGNGFAGAGAGFGAAGLALAPFTFGLSFVFAGATLGAGAGIGAIGAVVAGDGVRNEYREYVERYPEIKFPSIQSRDGIE
jgi:hypothetical protein